MFRLNASAVLQVVGCTTHEAGAADEALRPLQDRPNITVMFPDINLPGDHDGMALAEAVTASALMFA